MIIAAIADDERASVEETERCIEKYMAQKGIEVKTEIYTDSSEVLKRAVMYDILFLDIEMPGMNGITLARKIRQINNKLPVVYVTSYSKYQSEAFGVHSYDFLTKPITYEKVKRVLNDFLSEHRDKKKTVVFKLIDGSNYFVDISNICYFEYTGNRKVNVNMYNKECIRISTSMKALENEYGSCGFAMPHKSFLVNMDRVGGIDRLGHLLELDNGVKIDIAQRKQKEFQKALYEHFHKRLEKD